MTIKTDQPEAEVGLYENAKNLGYQKWLAHRELSVTIHQKIRSLLNDQNKDWQDIKAVVVYKGPGSFTGLRIGFSVGNALAYGNGIPIVSAKGKDWIDQGISKLENGTNDKIATPDYGAPAKTTKPRK